MNVRLVVDQGGKRTVMKLRPPAAVLGRARGNTVRIPSADVSRRHCRLLLKDGLVLIEDLDSANGTFLNGRRVKAAETVRPGDAIEVGPVTFVVEYELTTDALRRLRHDDDEPEDALVDVEVAEAEEFPLLEAVSDDAIEVNEDELLDVEPVDAAEAAEFVPLDLDLEESPFQIPSLGGLGGLGGLFGGGGDDDDEEERPTKRHKPRR